MSKPGPTPFQRAQISVETIGVSSAAIQRCYANPNQVREPERITKPGEWCLFCGCKWEPSRTSYGGN
jgi:hypothetical protein